MPYSRYPNGFANGVSIEGIPFAMIQNANGNTFWVDSNKGSNGNKGTEISPFATIDYAIGRCTANQGDTIFVAQGHAEAIIAAGTITADVAGINIIGLGVGENRPVLTSTTATAASFLVSADDVYIANMVFKCNIASQLAVLDCNAKRTHVVGCLFSEGNQTAITFIDINGGAENACDGVQILDCVFYSPTSGNHVSMIELGEVAADIVIDGCKFGDYSTEACIHNPTGNVLTNLTISNCTIVNAFAAKWAIELVSPSIGVISGNFMSTNAYATTIDPGLAYCFENYSVSAADVSGRLNPVVEV